MPSKSWTRGFDVTHYQMRYSRSCTRARGGQKVLSYFADHQCLIFSDIPNNRMLRFDEQTSEVSVFRADSGYSNGNTRDRQGRLVTCEHGARRVTRTELDGSITIIVDRYEGRRLNSPNDVVVRSDGTIWFTDPIYGISAHFEGAKTESEIGSCNVYRF